MTLAVVHLRGAERGRRQEERQDKKRERRERGGRQITLSLCFFVPSGGVPDWNTNPDYESLCGSRRSRIETGLWAGRRADGHAQRGDEEEMEREVGEEEREMLHKHRV